MAFELNYKVDGDILYGADLMENLSFSLTTSLNYALDGATTTNQENLITTTAFDDSSKAIYLDVGGVRTGISTCIFCHVLDEFEDASLDTDIWTFTDILGTDPSEADGYFSMTTGLSINNATYTGFVISDGVSGFDGYSATQVKEVQVRLTETISHGTGGNDDATYGRLYINDGSSDVLLKQITVSETAVYTYIFDGANQQVRLFKDGVEDGSSPFDLSGLSNVYYLKFWTTARESSSSTPYGDSSSMKLYYVGYLDGTAGTGQVTTGATTLDYSCSSGVAKLVSDQSDESSFTVQISADGTNFDSTSTRELVEIDNPGTSGRLRFELPLTTSLSATVPQMVVHSLTFSGYFG